MNDVFNLFIVFGLFTFLLILLFIVYYFQYKERSERNKIIVKLANNKELPPEERKLLIDNLAKGIDYTFLYNGYFTPDCDKYKNGFFYIVFAIGFALMGYFIDVNVDMDIHLISPLIIGLATIMGCTGIYFIVNGYLENKKQST